MDKKTIHSLKRFFGFTRSGASVVGKHALNVLSIDRAKRSLSVALIAGATAYILIHNLQNIGGKSLVELNVMAAPTVTIDAQTLASVQMPIDYEYESRGFSFFHTGADLVAPTGTPVYPVMAGKVELVSQERYGYGKHVVVSHDQGFTSLYAHLSAITVAQGQEVTLDTQLGKSGNTGNSTGPHLHLELTQNGKLVNPAEIVPGIN